MCIYYNDLTGPNACNKEVVAGLEPFVDTPYRDQFVLVRPGVHLRSESEINVESCFLSSGHTTESTLGQFRHLCQKASPTVVDIVHPDV